MGKYRKYLNTRLVFILCGFVLITMYKRSLASAFYDQRRIGNKKFFTTKVLLTLQYSARKPTTHNKQHTTTEMDHCHPTLQQLFPLSPWIGQQRQQLMAPQLPMGPCKARTIGLGDATVGSPVWGANASPIKILRGREGLGLRWMPINQDTQQSAQSW